MTEKAGVIYILTNPSFPDYVKIGYADNLEDRLKQLNRSECIPYAFRAYAIYETQERLSDRKLHALIDQLNPELRTIEEFDGKERKKEFYAMTAEEAFSLLEAIAEISGTRKNLKRLSPTGHEIIDEEKAKKVVNEGRERRSPFSFEKCHIPVGSELTFAKDESIKAIVMPNNKIKCNSEVGSLTAMAQKVLNITTNIPGPMFWKYQGRILPEIRSEMEEKGLYT